ncbi:hypothetical protein [Alicycliphilus denitrificans]
MAIIRPPCLEQWGRQSVAPFVLTIGDEIYMENSAAADAVLPAGGNAA